MAKLIEEQRAPYADKLSEELARTEALLYRRGNFNGSFDQLILDALIERRRRDRLLAGISLGNLALPGEAITLEQVMNQTAITIRYRGVRAFGRRDQIVDGRRMRQPVPSRSLLPAGRDMVRVGGMSYSCTPSARIGARIGDLRVRGRRIEADKMYKVASWAPVADGVAGEPIWEVLSRYLRDKKVVKPGRLGLPRLIGTEGTSGRVAGRLKAGGGAPCFAV